MEMQRLLIFSFGTNTSTTISKPEPRKGLRPFYQQLPLVSTLLIQKVTSAPDWQKVLDVTELVPCRRLLEEAPKDEGEDTHLIGLLLQVSSDSRKVFPVICTRFEAHSKHRWNHIKSKQHEWGVDLPYTVPTTSVTTVATVQNVSSCFLYGRHVTTSSSMFHLLVVGFQPMIR